MFGSPAAIMIKQYRQSHEHVFSFLQKLSDEQVHWRLSSNSHSIAFHAWHVGRWTDHLQASIPGMTPELGRRLPPGMQIWQAEGLADAWGFNPSQLGYGETGMRMPDETAMRLPFPFKTILLDYIGNVFAAAEHAVKAIDDEQFQNAEQPQPMTEGIWGRGSVGDALLSHFVHDNRHLGMMECLLGLQGRPGTATT